MKLRSLLKIYLISLVILHKYYEADTGTDKVAPHNSAHVMARFSPFIFTVFYFIAMFGELTVLITTVKGLNLHWCKSNFRKPAVCGSYRMLRKKLDCVLTRSQLSVEKECYSLNGTFLNAVNRQKSKQLQNHRKTPCV